MRGTGRIGKRHVVRTVTALVAVLGMGLVLAPPAQATWTTAYTLSPSGWMGQDWPVVSVDRQGDSLLVWAACDLATSGGCYFRVQARIRTKAGSMGSIKTLNPDGTATSWPMADSDDDGDSAVVWEQDGRIVGRRISAAGTVGPLKTLSTTLGINPKVAVGPDGRALVVWNEIRGGGDYTVSRYFNIDSTLGSVRQLGSGTADGPVVGVTRGGKAVVAWAVGIEKIVARRITPWSTSSTKTIMAPGSGIGYGRVSIGVDRDGDATIVFRRSRTGETSHVWARQWRRDGTLSGTFGISPGKDQVSWYNAVATDLEGDSMIVWGRWTSSTLTEAFGRRLSRSGTLGGVTRLGVGDRPEVAVDDDGNGLVVWQSPGSPYTAKEVWSRTIATSGAFGPGVRLSMDGSVPRVGASPTGRFSVIWQQKSYYYRIRARFGP